MATFGLDPPIMPGTRPPGQELRILVTVGELCWRTVGEKFAWPWLCLRAANLCSSRSCRCAARELSSGLDTMLAGEMVGASGTGVTILLAMVGGVRLLIVGGILSISLRRGHCADNVPVFT